MLPLWDSVVILCFVVRYFVSILILLDGEERPGCFAWVFFIVSLDCLVALPRGTMALSAVCDCGISWSYSLTISAQGYIKNSKA